MQSEHPFVLLRADEREAREFLRVIYPTLLRLTGAGGIICREDKHGDTLYDVRAQVQPHIGHAIYQLIQEYQVGREDVTDRMVREYLAQGRGTHMLVEDKVAWDHFPTNEELADLVINPVTQRDQRGNTYDPFPWPTGRRVPAICTACEADFSEGGWMGFAMDGGRLIRIIICAEHQNVTDYVEDAEYEGVPG